MNLDVAKKWVAALRSGKYKGAKGQLGKEKANGDMGFCCLGVLCTLYEEEFPKEQYLVCYEDGTPPDKVRDWAGLQSELGSYGKWREPDGQMNLAKQNDKYKRGFKAIANIIEKHVEEL